MPLVSVRQLLDHAAEHGYGVPDFNVKNLEQAQAITQAAFGVPMEEIQRGIRHGVRKINMDTDIRLAMTRAIRRAFNEVKTEFDPGKYPNPATLAAKSICKSRFEASGTAGNAGKIKPVPMKSWRLTEHRS